MCLRQELRTGFEAGCRESPLVDVKNRWPDSGVWLLDCSYRSARSKIRCAMYCRRSTVGGARAGKGPMADVV